MCIRDRPEDLPFSLILFLSCLALCDSERPMMPVYNSYWYYGWILENREQPMDQPFSIGNRLEIKELCWRKGPFHSDPGFQKSGWTDGSSDGGGFSRHIIPASRRTPDALREDQLGGFPETLPPSQAASAEDEKHQQWRNFCVGPDSRKFFGRRMIVLLGKFWFTGLNQPDSIFSPSRLQS